MRENAPFYLLSLLVLVLCTIEFVLPLVKERECIDYKYRVQTCDNCFNAFFLTDSITWENDMLIATDDEGKRRMVKPIEVEEGLFEDCKYVSK